MTGSALRLAGAASASPFGKFHAYEGTWDSTIFLWDGGYQPDGGVPANQSVLTNLARDNLAAISGLSGNDIDFQINNLAGPNLGVERTSKGGIHAASTQAGNQQVGAAFQFLTTEAFETWLLSQQDQGGDYAMLFQVWFELTRAQLSTNAPQAAIYETANVNATGNTFGYVSDAGNFPGVSIGVAQNRNGLGVPGVIALASQGWKGSKPASAAATKTVLANVGAADAFAGFNLNKAPSGIIYRVQVDLCDLSDIAGADRNAKAAAMLSAHNKMLARDFAAGGRFAGDTYTDPATLKA